MDTGGIVAVVIGVLGIAAAFVIYFLQKNRKELTVIIGQPILLVNVRSEAKQDIQVFYNSRPVNNVLLVQAQITNTGNVPISARDYVHPLAFMISPEYELAKAEVASSKPENIDMQVAEATTRKVVMSSALLNQDDLLSVNFVLVNEGDKVKSPTSLVQVDGRIEGVKQIKTSPPSDKPNWLIQPLGWLVTLAAVIVGLGASLSSPSTLAAISEILLLVLVILTVGALLLPFDRWLFQRR